MKRKKSLIVNIEETSYYIGIMSGTSLDGIDIALCSINKQQCRLVASREYPFPMKLKKQILKLIKNHITIAKVGEIDHKLGVLFAKSVKSFLREIKVKKSQIEAIGLHGQTVWHSPTGKTPFTMQLGDANIITSSTGIKVVSDFRRKDVALGGEGAPFAPAFHKFLFGDSQKSAFLNIGGMANITILDKKLIGYDTGCGNVLMDIWINLHRNLQFDRDGDWAKSGDLDYFLLESMLNDEYFAQSYPKSTGREKFNKKWIKSYTSKYEYSPENIQRTLLELTTITITDELEKFNIKKLFIGGGGAKNSFLVERLNTLLPNTQIEIVDNADMIEAMTFAWLGYKRVRREKVKLKSVTGAKKNSILGAIYE
ncbi:MAG: anhydro-N-acetylmuramic acid kinase [Sulfurovum sp.]